MELIKNHRLKAVCVTTLACLSLIGCRPMYLATVSPSGPPEYRLGWEDGCDSGISADDGGFFYKWTLGFKKRPEMAGEEQYKAGWNEGFSYCRFSSSASKDDRGDWYGGF